MSFKKEVNFGYGALCGTLEEQANTQGLTLGKVAEKLEKIRRAINMCHFHVATEREHINMINRLHKKVMDNLREVEPESTSFDDVGWAPVDWHDEDLPF